MKKFLILSLITFAATSLLAQNSDLADIEATLNDYMYGGSEGDVDRLVSAFHPDAMMKMMRNGEYQEVNAKEFFGKGDGNKIERENKILAIDVTGHVAMAKLQLRYDERQFVDYMTLMKIDDEWKIINKTFYVDMFAKENSN